MITSLGAEAVERAQAIARQADIIAALTLEVLKGTTKAFDSGEHCSRGCEKKIKLAGNIYLQLQGLVSILSLRILWIHRHPLAASSPWTDRGGSTLPLTAGL